MVIISKQVASQTCDEKTRNKTAPGEKPLSHEYLVMMQVSVHATTVESHGHTLLASYPTSSGHIVLFVSARGVACAIIRLHCYGYSTCIGAKRTAHPKSLQHLTSALEFLAADLKETAQRLIPLRNSISNACLSQMLRLKQS
ncbi:hypothetical protein ACHAWF_004406 [Thalassiosira exigua]